MQRSHVDVLVIGSGAGLKIARAAAADGRETVLIEKEDLGGTCLNRGCIPSKMLIYPADFIHLCRRAGRIDLDLPQLPRARFPELAKRVNQRVAQISQDIESAVRHTPRLSLIQGEARLCGERCVAAGDRIISADQLFLAVGTRPARPGIPGLAATPYMTSREALQNTQLPRRMIVIGAGYIACELGHAYGSFGCETHFMVRSCPLRREDHDLRRIFRERFGRSHHLHEGVAVQRVDYADGLFRVRVSGPDGACTDHESEALLVATGVDTVSRALDPEAAGIDLDPEGYIRVDDRLRTSAENVYALGDCIGRYFFRHSANREADYLIRTALHGSDEGPLDYGPMPHAVFTVPEIAALGATEDDLRENGTCYVAGAATYADSNQGLARGEDTGLVKLLADPRDGRLLGAHAIGEEASNLIHILIAVMYRRGTLQDLLDMVYIHPALPEIVRDAARDAQQKREEP